MNNVCIKQKLIFVSIILLFSIFQVRASKTFASPPAPTPRCYVEGIIQKVTHEDALNNNINKCTQCIYKQGATDMPTYIPERYELKILINKTSYVDGESFQSCDSLFPIGVIKEIVINKDKITDNTIPAIKQKITGTVRSFWWASFDNYSLTPIKNSNNINFFERIKLFLNSIRQFLKL